jgi:glycerol kinase
MTERYVGAIDQGTTGTRFVVFDRPGAIAGSAYETHEQHYPEPGWVEHDPAEIWENTQAVVRRGLADAGVAGGDLAAVGVTNQRETAVAWDPATGEPARRAIVWQDRRTTGRVEALRERGLTDEIRATTGLEPDAYFSATKFEWLLDEVGLRERAEAGDLALGTVDSWLLSNLTGRHATDVTNASRTMLFDIHDLSWDDDLLAEFGVPRAALPEVLPSSADYGRTDSDGVFGATVPVAGVLGDQQAALFGQTCFEPGEAKSTTGTGSFVLAHTGTDPVASDHGLVTTVAYQQAGEAATYALEGSIFVTGAAVEWLADVGLLDDPGESERVAREVDSTDCVYVVPAFAGLGAPHWDQRARGTIVGLTRGTRREHVVRATLESVAFQTRDVVEAMAADSGVPVETLRVDGGAVENDLLCQQAADYLDAPVERPAVRETTALGAAYAAGLHVGVWPDHDALRNNRRVERTFQPEMDRAEADRRYGRWGDAVERARDWARD